SSEIYGGDIYFKGAWVLHTLRYLIGDEAFFESLRRMAYPTEEIAATRDGSACRFARTVDYHNLVEEITGQDLDWFFEVYVRQPDLPELVSERDGDTVRVRWKTPGDLPFPMPVEVKIGGKVQKLGLSTDQPWEVTLPEGTDLELDPTGWILKK
ncbi:MAG: M1 family peptidase, partial [Planctomycetota bacterium]